MKKFEAKSLEEAYALATNEFNCSITDLEIDIEQQPRKGILGFGKKNAIIKVQEKRKHRRYDNRKIKEQKLKKKDIKIEEVSKKINDSKETSPKVEPKKESVNLKEVPTVETKEKIFDNFYDDDSKNQRNNLVIKKDQEKILDEVRDGINSLFLNTCYDINNVKVEFYDNETLYVEFTGEDSALLIGKEGYRYKALSYILFNWINEKYGLMLRLEVAEFLKNQEDSIHNYLEPVIDIIHEKGTFKTKPLDGILVHIALKRLRDEFPNKYVAVKTNARGARYVLVNEYRTKEQ